MEPALSLDAAKEKVKTKQFPRVTEESIKAKIATIKYVKEQQLTICVITMQNGFFVTGVSAPAHAGNYDKEIGERYAYENAFKQLWQLEGYLLRQKLYDEGT